MMMMMMTMMILRAAHLELASDDCQIRWQLWLLQGPVKDSSVWHVWRWRT